ncbi:hypothetical protein HK096_008542, partial [Nowakowskiella sp. JEL0078]
MSSSVVNLTPFLATANETRNKSSFLQTKNIRKLRQQIDSISEPTKKISESPICVLSKIFVLRPIKEDSLMTWVVGYVVICIHTFNLLFVPLCLGWPCVYLTKGSTMITMNWVFDFLLLLVTLIKCVSSNKDEFGQELETKLSVILYKNLIESVHLFEILCSIPIDGIIIATVTSDKICQDFRYT